MSQNTLHQDLTEVLERILHEPQLWAVVFDVLIEHLEKWNPSADPDIQNLIEVHLDSRFSQTMFEHISSKIEEEAIEREITFREQKNEGY